MNLGSFILRRSSIVALIYLLSSTLGFVRETATAYMFGASGHTDSYLIAAIIPSLFSGTLGGAITTSFVTVYSRYIANDKEEEALELANSALSLLGISLVVLMVIFLLFTPSLVHLFAPSYNGSRLRLTVNLSRLIMPTLIFGGLLGLLTGMNNSRHSFVAPACIGLAANCTIILGIIILGHPLGIYSLAIATSIAGIVQVLLQIPSILKYGFRFRPQFSLKQPVLKDMGILVAPFIISAVGSQVNLMVDRTLATSLPPGTVSAMYFANKLVILPQSIVGSAIGMVVLPLMSRFAAMGNWKELTTTLNQAVRAAVLVLLPIILGMYVLRFPLVYVIFQHGAFTYSETLVTAATVPYFLGVLFFATLTGIINQVFFAMKEIWVTIGSGVVVVAVNIILSLILVHHLQQRGLALANSISEAVKFGVLIIGLFVVLRLQKRAKLHWGRFCMFLIKVSLSSLVMSVSIQFLNTDWFNAAWGAGIQIALTLVVAIVIYLSCCLLLRVEEALQLSRLIRGFAGRIQSRA